MNAEINSSSHASYQEKRKERGKLVTLSLTLRSPKGGTAICGWKGHVLGQLDEVSEVSLHCVDIETPLILHPFPSQQGSLNSFYIFFPLFPPYHALSFQRY